MTDVAIEIQSLSAIALDQDAEAEAALVPQGPEPAPAPAPTVVSVTIAPARNPNIWSCPACTFDNRARRKRCEICETPRPVLEANDSSDSEADEAHSIEEEKKRVLEEKVSVVKRLAIENKWQQESKYQPESLQRVGNQMLVRILDFCDPGDIVSVGIANRWCQLISVTPELWKSLFDRDCEHFLDELPDKKKLLASSVLQSVILNRKGVYSFSGWEKNGGGKNAYLSVLKNLNERCDQKEIEMRESRKREQQDTHEFRMNNVLEFFWTILGIGFGLFVLTLILLIVKLAYPDALSWGGVLSPLASACVLHCLYLLYGGCYSFVACCMHPRALMNTSWVGSGVFWMSVISIPWALFPLLLILEIEHVIFWSYSYIFISFYLALLGGAVFWSYWLYIDNGRYCSSNIVLPSFIVNAIVALLLGLFIPMGLKLDGLYDGLWVVIWTPIWIGLFTLCVLACLLTYVMIEDSDYTKLVFWVFLLDLFAQFILIPLKLDSPDMCDWLLIIIPLILWLCSLACACCFGIVTGFYDALAS